MKEKTPDIRYEIVLCWEFFVWRKRIKNLDNYILYIMILLQEMRTSVIVKIETHQISGYFLFSLKDHFSNQEVQANIPTKNFIKYMG